MTDHFRRTPMRAMRVERLCATDLCSGEMRSTGEGFTQITTRWKHECNTCGRVEWFDKSYPRIEHEPDLDRR